MTTFLLALAIAGAAFMLLFILSACVVSGRLAEEEERHDPTP